MKTIICISALLSQSSAIVCVDERTKAAAVQKGKVEGQLTEASDGMVKAMNLAKEIPAKDLLSYEKVMNTLSVSVVSAKSYQATVDGTKDETAEGNAKTQVQAAMIAMAYEASKPGAEKVKKAIDDVRTATVAVKIAEERKDNTVKEEIAAENACVPGQLGQVPDYEAEDKEYDIKSLSIPSQIHLKAIIKADICPQQCKEEYDAYEDFKSVGEKDQWLENCLSLCKKEDNILDKDYESWAAELPDDQKPKTLKEEVDKKEEIITRDDIQKQYEIQDSTVKLTFACRNTAGNSVCFDSNGQTIAVSVNKNVKKAEKNDDQIPCSEATLAERAAGLCTQPPCSEATVAEKAAGLCDSAFSPLRQKLAGLMALSATVLYISSEQY